MWDPRLTEGRHIGEANFANASRISTNTSIMNATLPIASSESESTQVASFLRTSHLGYLILIHRLLAVGMAWFVKPIPHFECLGGAFKIVRRMMSQLA